MISWPDPRRLLTGLGALAASGLLAAEPATFATRVAPIFEKNCTGCHGADKQKGGLRLDSFAGVMRGSDDRIVIKTGELKASELHRRITLPANDDDVMPSDGKPHLTDDEIMVLEKWIAAGAPATEPFDAPALEAVIVLPPAAPDYRPRLAAATELARTLGVRLVPRSRGPTDGLVLRTASAPLRCDDAVLAQLAPYADLIVEAELARTKITDNGLGSLAACENLRSLDLTRTAVTARGLPALGALKKLETLNLTDTAVDATGAAALQTLPALRHLWLFGTPAEGTP